MHSIDIINFLIDTHHYKRYLEIGVYQSHTYNAIIAQEKDGIDKFYPATFKMTSDEFFARPDNKMYDIVFVDGQHLYEQALKDINNSLTLLSPGGTIVVHDCLPVEEKHQVRKTEWWGDVWTGDVWKAFAITRTRPDLEAYVVDEYWGHGIIRRGKQVPITLPAELTWKYFKAHRNEMLGVVSQEKFLETEKERA